MKRPELHPLLFRPILKNIIWGGDRICDYKGISPRQSNIGESWELSHIPGSISVVSNSTLAGRDLDELIQEYGDRLLGQGVIDKYGGQFPLLIKFIDAADDLSIQVHPNDDLARERHNCLGKTEMWYVIDALPGAALYSGFSQPMTADEYLVRVAENSLADVLKRYEVKAGDVFHLPAGRVHAICKGCFIAEIQQSSNITYRIFDYNRKDATGNRRELHTDLAVEAIDFTFVADHRTHYEPAKDVPVLLSSCEHFVTHLLHLTRPYERDLSSLPSFIIYICLRGRITILDDKGHTVHAGQGDTVLIPADTGRIAICPQTEEALLIGGW